MADKPASEKTEQPTARRLSKVREEGQVPQSQELAAAATLLALLVALVTLGPDLLEWSKQEIQEGLSAADASGTFTDSQAFLNLMRTDTIDVLLVLLPFLAILAVAGVIASAAVGGLTFTPSAIQMRWNAINPAHALGSLINKRSVVHLLTSILKLAFVSLIAWIYLRDKLEDFAALRWAWSTQLMTATAGIIFGLFVRIAIAILVIGLADAYYQKWNYIQELKMTRDEVRMERKDTEGSPEVKARIRRLQIEISMRRLRQDVPKANVILVNPTHVAVALRYDPKTMEAPILLAKGADHMAQKIIQIGRSYGIPIVQRPEIARAIYASV
ncbi:MAG: EscU/YscU/HrcU family type III secretion system export apparatus switch protein, partial [Planctomycetes bacterium]|nr:EscU/YscU/HrcU family type III secretion system export apparatus switch protein [Planctomycetota bacterium]